MGATTFGQRVKSARKAAGLTQITVAKRAGLSQSMIAEIENDEYHGTTKINALARALGANAEWLESGRGKMEARSVAEPVPVYQVEDREYEFVRRVRGAVLSAGPGSITFEVEEVDQSHAFRKEWLRKRGLKVERCRVMEVHGDSMHPYLNDGDVVLVNLEDRRVRDGEVYAILVDNEPRIKRLLQLTGGRLEIRSDNPSPKHRSEVLDADQIERLEIIGRVVWRGG